MYCSFRLSKDFCGVHAHMNSFLWSDLFVRLFVCFNRSMMTMQPVRIYWCPSCACSVRCSQQAIRPPFSTVPRNQLRVLSSTWLGAQFMPPPTTAQIRPLKCCACFPPKPILKHYSYRICLRHRALLQQPLPVSGWLTRISSLRVVPVPLPLRASFHSVPDSGLSDTIAATDASSTGTQRKPCANYPVGT